MAEKPLARCMQYDPPGVPLTLAAKTEKMQGLSGRRDGIRMGVV